MIFETERLLIRKLNFNEIEGFHELESNPNVLKYATGYVKNYTENKEELLNLIKRYSLKNNNFWIYAIESKYSHEFLGTVALVKDGNDDEIGYRFLERFWNKKYATELCRGLIKYCKTLGLSKIVGYVINENIASINIVENLKFNKVKEYLNEDNLLETKFELIL